jgi:hypothetical protein
MESLVGQLFGKWKVKEEVAPKNKHRRYLCVCECGTESILDVTNLKQGNTTQCQHCKGKRQICPKGHDTGLVGRAEGGRCRLCAKNAHLETKYGITLEEYEELFRFQNGKCAICGRLLALNKFEGILQDPTLGRAEVDHKHYLKKDAKKVDKKSTVRGILCGGRYAGCNAKLGHVDNVEWLRAAATYLENPPAQQLFQKGKKV